MGEALLQHPCDIMPPCKRHQDFEILLAVHEEKMKAYDDTLKDQHDLLLKMGENMNAMTSSLAAIQAEISGLKGKVLGFMAAGSVFVAVVSFVAQYMVPIINHVSK